MNDIPNNTNNTNNTQAVAIDPMHSTKITLKRNYKGGYSWSIQLTEKTMPQQVQRILDYIKQTAQHLNQEYKNQSETNNRG